MATRINLSERQVKGHKFSFRKMQLQSQFKIGAQYFASSRSQAYQNCFLATKFYQTYENLDNNAKRLHHTYR